MPPCTVTGSDDLGVTAGSTVVVVTAEPNNTRGRADWSLRGRMWRWRSNLRRSYWNSHPKRWSCSSPIRSTSSPMPRPGPSTHRRGASSAPERCWTPADFRFVIARRAGIAVGNVHGLIVGEHGDSEIRCGPVCRSAVPAEQFHADGAMVFDEQARAEISAEVVGAAYEIIAGKGATSFGDRLVHGQDRRSDPGRPASGPARLDGATRHLRHHRGGVVVADRGRCRGAGPVLPVPLAVSELLGLQASAATLRRAQSGLRL